MSTSGSGRGVTLLAGLLACVAGCGSSKDPAPPPAPPVLVLTRVSVAVGPGGTEIVDVSPLAGGDTYAPYTVASSDEGIATAAIAGARITITGVAVGKATITVNGTGGATRALPVQVYDHHVMDTGELLITFADAFEKIFDLPNVVYNDAQLLLNTEVIGASVWRPVPPAGFHALGSFMLSPSSDPNAKKAVMVVKAKEGSNALVLTSEYEQVYRVEWTRTTTARGAQIWRPVCPTGYVAMGMVANFGAADNVPPAYPTPCVRQDLAIGGAAGGTAIHSTSGLEILSFWDVDLPNVGSHSGAYLAPGTFVLAAGTTTAPAFDPALNVLNVQLPLLAEAPAQEFVPKLTSISEPDAETPPRFARAMLVPCTLVNDLLHTDVPWRVANSPFYRLERHVFYRRLFHTYNSSTEMQPFEVTVTSGITTTEANTFRTSTNVSISAEAGIELKGIFSAKVTTTVSREFGYETQTAISALQERSVTTPIYSAPGKATALWQQFNRYVLYRHDGAALSAVTAWEFGIESYVVDDFPD